MHLLYLRQTQNELTGEHSAILCRALPRRTGYDDAWLPAFAIDARRRILSLLSGPFSHLEVKTATAILGDLTSLQRETKKTMDAEENTESSADAIASRSGTPSGCLTATELNYLITPHDLKRLELYGRNLCDHHLITDLLSPVARLYFTGRFEAGFALSNLQTALLCGIGLQHRSVDQVAEEFSIPVNQVLAMFNKAIRKVSIALRTVLENEEKSKLLSDEARLSIEKKNEKLKNVDRKTLEEDARDGAKEALAKMESHNNRLPPELAGDPEIRNYVVKGTEEQWSKALKNSDGTVPPRVQIESKKTSPAKRKLDQADIEKEMKNDNKKKKKTSQKKKKKN